MDHIPHSLSIMELALLVTISFYLFSDLQSDKIVLLDAQVPGGQSVFVLPNGELGFTEPHSGAYPAGAVTTGFVETPGSTYATFGFTGLGATGFVACPTVNNTGPYQVYAQVTGFIPSNSNDCIGFDTIAYTPTGPGAFEYL